MNKLKLLRYFNVILLVSFITPAFIVLANAEEKEEPFFGQLTRAVVRIEEHQSVCVPGLKWSFEQNVPKGTGFFLNHKHTGGSDFYIVTARHVVDKRADLDNLGAGQDNKLLLRQKVEKRARNNTYIAIFGPENRHIAPFQAMVLNILNIIAGS